MTLAINIHLPLKHFNLEIKQTLTVNEITAIFGYSGAGKTSLLRAIAGLEKNTSGEISFNNKAWLNSNNKTN